MIIKIIKIILIIALFLAIGFLFADDFIDALI